MKNSTLTGFRRRQKPLAKARSAHRPPECSSLFFYVYILKGHDGKPYTGYTRDLDDRMSRHIRGSVPATKNRRPLELVSYIAFKDKYQAIEYEKYLKTGSGRAVLYKRFFK